MSREEIEIKKKELKDKLENSLYVERYDTFKESVELINLSLISFRINHQYNYNEFCSEFTEACLEYVEKHPDVDMTDAKQIIIYTLPIVMSIVEKAKNKYGLINEER